MIEQTQHPYELLIRLDENGVVGAHVRKLERVKNTDTGEVLAEKELPAEPVELTEEDIAWINSKAGL